MAGLIDPTKTGNYPVILGDGLQGKTSNEIFTGIRYNHKPVLSSPSAPSSARLKPSTPGKTTSYDLNYTDDDQKYSFTGPRNNDEKQYVLWFDPARKAFILDKVDSTFNMNVTRLPDNSDPESLRRQHPPIELPSRPAPKPSKPAEAKPDNESSAPKPRAKPAAKPPVKPAAKPQAKPPVQKKEVKRKPEKKQPPKSINLSLPVPEPEDQRLAREKEEREKEKAKRRQLEEEEDEDDDDDGGLLVEYPDGDPRTTRQTDFSPAFPSVRRFDDFMNQRESEGDDADGEDDDDPDNDFKLPSPVNNHSQPVLPQPVEPQYEEEDDGGDLEDDLEKDLEMAFGDMESSHAPAMDDGDESEISEED